MRKAMIQNRTILVRGHPNRVPWFEVESIPLGEKHPNFPVNWSTQSVILFRKAAHVDVQITINK